MKFIDNLSEALEQPDLPEEDQWGEYKTHIRLIIQPHNREDEDDVTNILTGLGFTCTDRIIADGNLRKYFLSMRTKEEIEDKFNKDLRFANMGHEYFFMPSKRIVAIELRELQ